METGNIERRLGLNWDQFIKEYVAPNKPVILTDAAANWKAHGLFNPDFFKKNYPNKTASINGKRYNLTDYIDMMLAGTEENPAPHSYKIDIERNFRELRPLISPG